MKIINPGTFSQLEEARNLILLADTQEQLHMLGVKDLSLHMEVQQGGARYVIAKNRLGEEITSQDSDGRGAHGQYVHPINGDASNVAYYIMCSARARAEKAQ